jgi:hypothetical protein
MNKTRFTEEQMVTVRGVNGITSRRRRVTNDDAANPRPPLTNGHVRTNAGSGSVPGGPPLYGCAHPAVSGVSDRDHSAWAADKWLTIGSDEGGCRLGWVAENLKKIV